MNEEQKEEARVISKSRKWTMERLLSMINLCPQIFQSGIGAEAFVEELNKARIKMAECADETIFAMEELLQVIRVCPQIYQPGISAEAFVDDLSKAAKKFKECFIGPNP